MKFLEVEEELWRVAEKFSESVYHLQLNRTTGELNAEYPAAVAWLEVTGAYPSYLVLATTTRVIDQATRQVFGIPLFETPSDEQRDDVLKELANILAGNVKYVLPEPCLLSTPSCSKPPLSEPACPALEVIFSCTGDPFIVSLYRNENCAAAFHF